MTNPFALLGVANVEQAGLGRHAPVRVDLRRKRVAAWAVAAIAAFCSAAFGAQPLRADEAVAASGPPVHVSVFVNSRTSQCYHNGYLEATTRLAKEARDRINASGGVAGRPVVLQFHDERGDAKQALANVRTALADPLTVAMIGMTSSDRAKEVFDQAGADIRDSGVPFISNIMVTTLFEDYPNVFSMRGSQEDDSIPVIARFIRDMGFRRPAFVGLKDQLFSSALGDGLKERLDSSEFVADHRLTLTENALDPAEIAAAISDLKEKNPDFVFLSIGGSRNAAFLDEFGKSGATPPVFVSGRIETVEARAETPYPGDLYQLTWDGPPEAYNDRLRRRISPANADDWLFQGRRNPDAAGWASGECKETPKPSAADVLSAANVRAIVLGAQFADMVSLLSQATRHTAGTADIATIRADIVKAMTTTFASGRGVFQGSLENWSFRPSSRAAARTPFVLIRPKGLNATQLAPIQYLGLKNDQLRQIKTLYMDVDLIRAFRVDDNEKSFAADFYLSMHDSKGQTIDQIEFANAFIDPNNNERQLTIRTLHAGGKSGVYPDGMRIYAVSGKFMFEPQFSNYPFDTQRFSLDIRPKVGDAPFIIQSPPPRLRDGAADTDGWELSEEYVGYDEDFLPVIDAMSHDRSVVPFYKGSFVWIMQREATDYFLRVVIPLIFIMGIAYLAIFIPNSHFEAIVTIQVTALLSAVALYLTIPKVAADVATVSDRIFLFDYMIVSLMIVISILRVNRPLERAPKFRYGLWLFHVVMIPVMAGLMALYVVRSSFSGATGSTATMAGMWAQLFP